MALFLEKEFDNFMSIGMNVCLRKKLILLSLGAEAFRAFKGVLNLAFEFALSKGYVNKSPVTRMSNSYTGSVRASVTPSRITTS